MSVLSPSMSHIPDTSSIHEDDVTEADYWDVLPSFQMHQSIIRRQLNQVNDSNQGNMLPAYSESSTDLNASLEERVSFISPVNSLPIPVLTNTSTSPSGGEAFVLDGTLSESTVIDNIDILRKKPDTRLKVDVHVTTNKHRLHVKNESVNKMKEYISGDLIHGYVVIENVSSVPITFEMFTVSLEGILTTYDKNGNPSRKTFMRMFDLSAGFHFGCITASSGFDYKSYVHDKYDDSFTGLPDDRVLAPNTKYKKVFTFKAPHILLDDTCVHEQSFHTALPPSFGIAKKFKGRENVTKVDPALGYAYLSLKGSPILTDDGSYDSHSISYTVEARVIDKFNSKNENSCNIGCDSFCISAEDSFNLRFIPFGFPQPFLDFKKQSKIEIDNLCKEIELAIDERRAGPSNGNSSSEMRSTASSDSIKLDQLRISNNDSPLDKRTEATQTLVSSSKHIYKSAKPKLTQLFSKKHRTNEASVQREYRGLFKIFSSLPSGGLPYISPSIMQKSNGREALNDTGLENLDYLQNSLESSEKVDLSSLEIELEYALNNEIGDMKLLPKIENVTFDLLCITFQSNFTIPVLLYSELFLENKDDPTRLTSEALKSKFYEYLNTIMNFPGKTLFRKRMINDIKSILTLTHKVVSIPLFQVKDYKSSNWEKSDRQENTFTKKIFVGMDLRKIKETLVPSFQTCLIGRTYSIQVTVNFTGLGDDNSIVLTLPVRVRTYKG